MFSLQLLYPGMYYLRIEDRYTCNMTFLRASEWSESVVWRHTTFTLVEYMDWYAANRSTAKYPGEGIVPLFSYPTDWSGFNIPSTALDYLYPERGPSPIPDWNCYDDFMQAIANQIRRRTRDFYLIGSSGQEEGYVLRHEVAHGFYYLDPDYRTAQDESLGLCTKTKEGKRFLSSLRKILTRMDYAADVHDDEMQAYLSTGPTTEMNRISKGAEWKRAAKRASSIFRDRHAAA